MDIETYSSVDLKTSGVYKYSEAADFQILLFAYSVDSGEVHVVDLAQGEKLPPEIIEALNDINIQKWAYNAMFERICLSRHLFGKGKYLKPDSWKCTMVWSAYLGLPLALENVGEVLEFQDQKMAEGKRLIRYFSKPCGPTKANGGRTRNLPCHDMEKWSAFKAYNRRDVEVEIAIQARLSKYPVPDNIWDEYQQDQEINDRGIAIDTVLVKNAIAIDKLSHSALMEKMRKLTGLENPNSILQLRGWFADNGIAAISLDKDAVKEMLKTQPAGAVREALLLRQQMAKTSVKKYTAMTKCVCADGRTRGMFQFYGANRTGRWAGRLIQLQNLPRNFLPDLDEARGLVRQGNYEALEMLYKSIPDVLSELIRTAFIPKAGCSLLVADFSSIERVVLAWLAGEKWVLDAYSANQDLYIATASKMFNVPMDKINKKSPLRHKGKTADLGCGYGGSVGALINMGALEQGLTEKELPALVNAWREANPSIVRFWWAVGNAAMEAVTEGTTAVTHGIKFQYKSKMLFITLPSRRKLAYVKPEIGTNRFDRDCVTYMGIADNRKWERIQSYGAKFVENITQALARDLLAHAMQTLRQYQIVAHIHDELVLEANPSISLGAICQQMVKMPKWAKGLELRADGFVTQFYQKD